tara:strand:- start:283 stop:534 length:252 start_codon:yes stop_codon:yes gene_type:complete
MSSQLEKENLEAHVDLCAERYKGLESRLEKVESKLEKIDSDLTEIKAMISLGQSNQFRMLLSTAGGIITVLLAVLGYLFIKLV